MNELNKSNEFLNNKNDERDKKREVWNERVERASNNIYILNSIIFKKIVFNFVNNLNYLIFYNDLFSKYYDYCQRVISSRTWTTLTNFFFSQNQILQKLVFYLLYLNLVTLAIQF